MCEEGYDYGEEEQGRHFMSDSKCRTCGRRGCEGGAACEIAAEMRADL